MPTQVGKTFGPNTLNNYTERDIAWLRELECTKLTCSKEVGDEGTPHLQFSITFKRTYSIAGLKKLHPRVHWEFQRCHQDNNYCRKIDSEIIIDIDNRRQGKRQDINVVKQVCRETLSMRAVVEEATSVQSVRMAELWLKYNEPKRPIAPELIKVFWRWGKTGLHKTRYVWDNHGIDEVYVPTSYKWWEGYDGHRVVLIDDLRANWCTFGQLIKLLDIYPYTVETKGGSRQIQAVTWYITSCYPPDNLYKKHDFDADERVEQLLRRLTDVVHITKIPEPPVVGPLDSYLTLTG